MANELWTRRRLLGAAAEGALATEPADSWPMEAGQEPLPLPKSKASSPEITPGHVAPLLEELQSTRLQRHLYGIVLALLGVTLER